jgi:hypothetical protein
MELRKTVIFQDETAIENGTPLATPLRRVVVGSVLKNPLVGKPVGTDLKPLIDISVELGERMTRKALSLIGDAKTLRSYTKGAMVGLAGDLEHGAVMIHARIGMAMRATLKRGRVIIPGNAKVAAAGAAMDLIFGPIDEAWDLDASDSMAISVGDAPRPDELLLMVGYATGPRPHARSKGPDQAEVDALIRSFG